MKLEKLEIELSQDDWDNLYEGVRKCVTGDDTKYRHQVSGTEVILCYCGIECPLKGVKDIFIYNRHICNTANYEVKRRE